MKSILLLLTIVVVVANAYTQTEYQTTFTEWMIKNQRSYTVGEFQKRFDAFRANMDFVRDWNALESSTVVGLNNMADLTNEEYRSIYLGTKINFGNGEEESDVAPIVAENKLHTRADNYTLLVDWRAKSAVTPIKDQGQCGSCWAFSSTGSIEGAWYLATGKLVSLSEQNLMDCSTAQGNEACNGGLMDQAFDYIIESKGVDTEAFYPYTAKTGACRFTVANIGASITSYKDIPEKDEVTLAQAVAKQPVSVAIDASHISFQLYVSGVYNPTLLGKVTCSQTNLDHGVLAVGYGVENGVTNFWVVKNSWGTSWGQAGYIYMSKDKNNQCGIATAASYPIV